MASVVRTEGGRPRGAGSGLKACVNQLMASGHWPGPVLSGHKGDSYSLLLCEDGLGGTAAACQCCNGARNPEGGRENCCVGLLAQAVHTPRQSADMRLHRQPWECRGGRPSTGQ